MQAPGQEKAASRRTWREPLYVLCILTFIGVVICMLAGGQGQRQLLCALLFAHGFFLVCLPFQPKSAGALKTADQGEESSNVQEGLPNSISARLGIDSTGQQDTHISAVHRTLSKSLTTGSKEARSFIESMPVGLLALDSQGMIKFANLRALIVLRSPAIRVYGRSIADFVSLVDTPQPFCDLLAGALDNLVEGRARSLDPATPPLAVDVAFGALEDGGGDKGYIVSITDISHRYEIEKFRQEFLAMVSHDLRTPLTSVGLFFFRLMRDEDCQLSEKFLKSAQNAQQSVQRLIKLVNSLLDVNMIRHGKFLLNKEEEQAEDCLAMVVDSIAALAAEKGITIATTVDCHATVVMDRDRIYQVMENMGTNAIKFSPRDTTVSISLKRVDGWLQFEICDQGPGIPEDAIVRLFGRHEQVCVEDQKGHKGFGLGLAICKHIVEAHGGQIGVVSMVGKGSQFWFKLPC